MEVLFGEVGGMLQCWKDGVLRRLPIDDHTISRHACINFIDADQGLWRNSGCLPPVYTRHLSSHGIGCV